MGASEALEHLALAYDKQRETFERLERSGAVRTQSGREELRARIASFETAATMARVMAEDMRP